MRRKNRPESGSSFYSCETSSDDSATQCPSDTSEKTMDLPASDATPIVPGPDDEPKLADLKHLHWRLCVCAILRYIDNGHAKGATPAEVQKGIPLKYMVYRYDKKAEKFVERDPKRIGEIMAEIVRWEKYSPPSVQSQRDLVQRGSKGCTPYLLKHCGYATNSPPLRSASSKDSPVSSTTNEDENVVSTLDHAEGNKSRGNPSQTRIFDPGASTAKLPSDRRTSMVAMASTADASASPPHQETSVGGTRPRKRRISQSLAGYVEIPRCDVAVEGVGDSRRREGAHRVSRKISTRSTVATLPTSMLFADTTSFSLDEADIERRVHEMYSSVVSLVSHEMKLQEIEDDQKAVFASSAAPNPGLQGLYRHLLGASTLSENRANVQCSMPAADLVIALIGAYVHVDIFHPKNVKTAEHWLSEGDAWIGELRECMDAHLGALGTNFDAIARRTFLSHVDLLTFQDEKLEPLANELALELAFRLFYHIRARKSGLSLRANAYEYATSHWSPALSKVIKLALVLKCILSSAREHYRLSWFAAGTQYDPSAMESQHGGGSVVLTTVFPGVVVESEAGIRTVCRAQVRIT